MLYENIVQGRDLGSVLCMGGGTDGSTERGEWEERGQGSKGIFLCTFLLQVLL